MNVICFSHLRWDFVFQRPQHLLTRFAKSGTVYYIEEPLFSEGRQDSWNRRKIPDQAVEVLVPVLMGNGPVPGIADRLKKLLDSFIAENNLTDFITWYYFPLALEFSDHLKPRAVVYDCMDELSAFKGASPEIVTRENELFSIADIVFTGGQRLYESKKARHHNIYAFPSSIDKAAFVPARIEQNDPEDQAGIPHPRLGFFGVLDERFDASLVAEMASKKPDWNFVFIGPVVKIDASELPHLPNIHYLGMKDYRQLPGYISGWDVCIMPFAINASTEFISPTKTPEFMAAGKRVVSTPIHDVVHPYGDKGLVGIGATADDLIGIVARYLAGDSYDTWLMAADGHLEGMSWDKTFKEMKDRIDIVVTAKSIVKHLNEGQHV